MCSLPHASGHDLLQRLSARQIGAKAVFVVAGAQRQRRSGLPDPQFVCVYAVPVAALFGGKKEQDRSRCSA
jgi:hypothetical protein